MIKLIGISGKARAGKDTLAKHLVELGYYQMAFADGVKHVTSYLAGEPVALFHDNAEKEMYSQNLGMARRRAMQNVGNAMREAIGPNVWIRPLLSAWKESGEFSAVISDVRYPNEAAAIRGHGGLIIRIERPNSPGLDGDAAAHVSEVPLPDNLIDLVVVNDRGVGDLFEVARTIVDRG